jgi:glycosidase
VEQAERLNVATQAGDPDSTLSFTRRLLDLRRRVGGAQRSVDAAPQLFCFLREGDERHLVALNFSSKEVKLGLAGRANLALSTDLTREAADVDLEQFLLRPDEGVLLRL